MFMKTNELRNSTHDVDENKGEIGLTRFDEPRKFRTCGGCAAGRPKPFL
jgi:hypothetical protein